MQGGPDARPPENPRVCHIHIGYTGILAYMGVVVSCSFVVSCARCDVSAQSCSRGYCFLPRYPYGREHIRLVLSLDHVHADEG